MKIFFMFALKFLDLPLAACKEISKTYPDLEVTGLVTGRKIVCDNLEKNEFYPVKHYDFLNDLEKQWLQNTPSKEKIEEIRNIFGDKAIRNLIISDREIGAGFVSGGIVDNTNLLKITAYDENKRMAYIIGLLDYALNYLKEHKPDIVFLYWIAGSTAYAFYLAGKALEIPVLNLPVVRIKDFWALDDSIDNNLTSVTKTYLKSYDNPELIKDYIEDAKKFLKEFKERPSIPSYMKVFESNYSLSQWAKEFAKDLVIYVGITLGAKGSKDIIRQRRGINIAFQSIGKFSQGRKALKNKHPYFIRFSEIPENTDYVFFPLHVDPEASTMVLAPDYTDQLHIIERLAKNLPIGMKLVVKEHAPMLGKRPKGFYERIYKMPDVYLVNPLDDSKEIIKKSKLVTVITGTAALEAVMFGIPVMIFGGMFISNLRSGVTKTDLENLDTSIPQAISNIPKQDDIEKMISCIFREGFRMNFDDVWYNVSPQIIKDKPEYYQQLAKAILRFHNK